MHKKCSSLERLTPNPDYRCTQCMGNARPIDVRPQSELQVGPDKLEVVASFCYLGDMLSTGWACEIAVTTRVKTAWKKFRELLLVLTSRHLSFHIPPPLLQDPWPCIQFLCAECHAPCQDLDLILRERRLRWFGHVERSNGTVRTACDIKIDGRQGAARPT